MVIINDLRVALIVVREIKILTNAMSLENIYSDISSWPLLKSVKLERLTNHGNKNRSLLRTCLPSKISTVNSYLHLQIEIEMYDGECIGQDRRICVGLVSLYLDMASGLRISKASKAVKKSVVC